jgi:hypothetical protein
MSITGNLKTMELAELLQWLAGAMKTGTLVVDNGKVTKQIFFRDGTISSTASTDKREHLGAFLVSYGLITDAELIQAIRMQESNRMLLGKILSTIGAITERDLNRMLRLKAEESIYDVFTWREGAFRFLDQQLPASNMVPMSLDVAAIVLEGMHRFDEWKRIREAIPSIDCVPVSVPPFEEKVMTEGAPRILALVDDQRSIGDICRVAMASEIHVGRILIRQIEAKRLKIVKPRLPVEAPPRVPEGLTSDALLAAGRGAAERGELDAALRFLRAARALDPDSRRTATEVEKVEDGVRAKVELAGVVPNSVPFLARTLEELTQLKITPQEGFLLTRFNGAYDLQSIVKISSMPPLDVQVAVWKLVQAGHIRLEKG